MNIDTGKIEDSEQIRKLFPEQDPPEAWTCFGIGDIVSLHNSTGKRIGWFRINLVTKKKVTILPISAQEAESRMMTNEDLKRLAKRDGR